LPSTASSCKLSPGGSVLRGMRISSPLPLVCPTAAPYHFNRSPPHSPKTPPQVSPTTSSHRQLKIEPPGLDFQLGVSSLARSPHRDPIRF
jgi:hypothetical protein